MISTNVSVIIPAFNEEQGLPEVIKRLRQALSFAGEYEIIVVDDASTDATPRIAAAAGVTVITNPVNVGYGFSLKRGFAAARFECVVITDADGTYPIESIPQMIVEYERGIDMVVGARQGKFYWSSFTKNTARYCFKWMSEFVVGKKIPDINSGLRVIRRSKIVPHLPDLSNRFSFTTSATLIFFLQHYFIAYLPIAYEARRGKSKVKYFRDALITLQIMVDIIAKYNPIKLFLLVGSLPFFVGTVLVLFALFFSNASLLLWASLHFLGGLLVVATGFFATIFKKVS